MIPPQPWSMEAIVGLTIVVSFVAVIWVVIGVVWLISHRGQKTWEDTRGDGE